MQARVYLSGVKDCDTLFYQGITTSQTQVAKYTGPRRTLLSNGQYVHCDGKNGLKPIDVMHRPFIGLEVTDINLEPFKRPASYFNPVKIMSSSMSFFVNRRLNIQISEHPEALPDKRARIKLHSINVSKISLAQEGDVLAHFQKYQKWKMQYPNNDLILWGVSKGAATTFNAMSTYQYPEVRLVVLEGCFNNLQEVFKSWHPQSVEALSRGLQMFTAFKLNGLTPEGCVQTFPRNVPVVFITSKLDRVVPAALTLKLAGKLAERGENPVYVLTLEKSRHGNYIFDDAKDRAAYENFMHAIYKEYALPYLPDCAEKGKGLLTQARLNTDKEVTQHVDTPGPGC